MFLRSTAFTTKLRLEHLSKMKLFYRLSPKDEKAEPKERALEPQGPGHVHQQRKVASTTTTRLSCCSSTRLLLDSRQSLRARELLGCCAKLDPTSTFLSVHL